jgi:hypothetical protein
LALIIEKVLVFNVPTMFHTLLKEREEPHLHHRALRDRGLSGGRKYNTPTSGREILLSRHGEEVPEAAIS